MCQFGSSFLVLGCLCELTFSQPNPFRTMALREWTAFAQGPPVPGAQRGRVLPSYTWAGNTPSGVQATVTAYLLPRDLVAIRAVVRGGDEISDTTLLALWPRLIGVIAPVAPLPVLVARPKPPPPPPPADVWGLPRRFYLASPFVPFKAPPPLPPRGLWEPEAEPDP